MYGGKTFNRFLSRSFLIDHNRERITIIGARLTKFKKNKFSLSICEMSVISDVPNLTG